MFLLMNRSLPVLLFAEDLSSYTVLEEDYLPYGLADLKTNILSMSEGQVAMRRFILRDWLMNRVFCVPVVSYPCDLCNSYDDYSLEEIVSISHLFNLDDYFWVRDEEDNITSWDMLVNNYLSDTNLLITRHTDEYSRMVEVNGLYTARNVIPYWRKIGSEWYKHYILEDIRDSLTLQAIAVKSEVMNDIGISTKIIECVYDDMIGANVLKEVMPYVDCGRYFVSVNEVNSYFGEDTDLRDITNYNTGYILDNMNIGMFLYADRLFYPSIGYIVDAYSNHIISINPMIPIGKDRLVNAATSVNLFTGRTLKESATDSLCKSVLREELFKDESRNLKDRWEELICHASS